MNDIQKLLEENYTLKYQVKKYAETIEHLHKIIEKKKESNEKMFEKYTQRGREINRLKARISWLESQLGKSEGEGAKD